MNPDAMALRQALLALRKSSLSAPIPVSLKTRIVALAETMPVKVVADTVGVSAPSIYTWRRSQTPKPNIVTTPVTRVTVMASLREPVLARINFSSCSLDFLDLHALREILPTLVGRR